MRYNQIDAQMRYIDPETAAREALANYLAARRAAKPRVRYVRRLRIYRISGKSFTTYGLSIEGAYRSWAITLKVRGVRI